MANKILISEDYPNISRLGIGLGWDPQPAEAEITSDLDISAFLLDKTQTLPSPNHIIFYHNKRSNDESILHLGDNRSGEGKMDDEIIVISLENVEDIINEIVIVTTVYNDNAEVKKGSFDPVKQAFIRLFDYTASDEILRFNIDEQFDCFNGLEFGRLKRKNGKWTFELTAKGYLRGLDGFVEQYA